MLNICKNLLEEGCNLSIYDPKVDEIQINKDLSDNNPNYNENTKVWQVNNCLLETVKGSDALVILTEWDEFLKLDLARIYKLMRVPSWIFDARNVIDIQNAQKVGFRVWKLGDGKLFN